MQARVLKSAHIGLIAAATLVLAPHSNGAAATSPIAPRFTAFDTYVSAALDEYHVPGAAVAIVENGHVVFLKGYGVSDIAKNTRVDADTVFQLASVSKTFTGVGAAMLVDERKLSWDRPIVAYLPRFVAYDPYVTRNMTVRDLLAHRTGWPKFTGDILGDFGYSRAEVIRRLRYLKPAYSFREVAQYSNFGYLVAGEVSARLAGRSWDEFVKKRIFDPLAMTRSSTSLRSLTGADTAEPYAMIGGLVQPTTRSDSDVMAAAGGVNSTAADMAHYLQFYLSNGSYGGTRLLKPDTIAAIYKRSMVSDVDFTEMPPISEATGYYYGMGVDSYDYDGHQIIEKAGALSGFRTVMTMLPDRHAGIVVLANLNLTTFPEAVRAYYLEHVLLGKSATADLKEITVRNEAIAAMFKRPTGAANPKPFSGKLQALTGTYANDLYGPCTISSPDTGLQIACGPAKYHAPLTHESGNMFLAQWPGATSLGDDITFTIDAKGSAIRFKDDALGIFTRTPPLH